MKIVLLTLSADPAHARKDLEARFPDASVELLSRDELEQGSAVQRVRLLRSLKPDVFAVATERLAWQRGQDAFQLLGALAGARASIVFDAHGGWREDSRTRSLTHAPARLAREATRSRAVIQHAEEELRALEAAVASREYRQPRYAGFQPAEPGRISRPEACVPKIVFIRSSPGPGTLAGGAATHIKGFIEAAQQLGADVSLVSNDEIAGLDQATLPTKIVWPEPFGSSRAAFDIHNNLRFTNVAVEEVEKQQPDFIYQRYARFSWAGVAAALRTTRPLFLEYNGSEVWVGQHWDRVDKLDLLGRYERLNLQAAARVFVVSEIERQQLLRDGIEDERIVVNPNGADVDRFRPGVGGEQVRRDLGIASDDVVIGFLGTFGPWHGVQVLAEAILRMPPGDRLRFLLVGGGGSRPQIEELLREQIAKRNVIFAGSVPHERVPSLLDACDMLVSPHVPLAGGREFFGSPTKIFEYMAMGKAIVASRLGQIGETLTAEKTAVLVEPGDVSQLVAAITRLAESPKLRKDLGTAAREAAVTRHTWIHNAKRVVDAYYSYVDWNK